MTRKMSSLKTSPKTCFSITQKTLDLMTFSAPPPATSGGLRTNSHILGGKTCAVTSLFNDFKAKHCATHFSPICAVPEN